MGIVRHAGHFHIEDFQFWWIGFCVGWLEFDYRLFHGYAEGVIRLSFFKKVYISRGVDWSSDVQHVWCCEH